jgi:hypothetical protein
MEKKSIIILSLLSAVLSLIYVLLSYFGLLRYYSLYYFDIKGYTKNYKNLDKLGKHRTVISMIVTQKQIIDIDHTIKSLLDQTVKVDLISITIPTDFDYTLKDELNDCVSIFRCDPDKGILNCLLPVIMREQESTTRIITLCDGIAYGKDFIETILEESENNPEKIIYVNKENYMDLSKGIVFSTKFFNEDFLDVPDNIDSNEWINEYFKNTQKIKIDYNENYNSI